MARKHSQHVGVVATGIGRSARLALFQVASLAALAACTPLTGPPLPGPEATQQAPQAPGEFSYTRVMELLHEGRRSAARTLLDAHLASHPDDTRAKRLLRQMQAPPEAFLGAASFDYDVQPGESLSELAQRFLGDYRLFIILARYNDIDTPSRLQAGQTIRIPSDYRDAAPSAGASQDRERHARQLLEASRPGDAVALYAQVPANTLGREALRTLGDAHRMWIEQALAGGHLDAARERLAAARAAAPASGSWSDWLDALARRTTIDTAYRQALAMRDREPAAAATVLRGVLEMDPQHAGARDALAALRDTTVPALHQEAVLLYRHQQLEKAIDLWEQIQVIDPDFEPAAGYLARARELRRRLEELD